MVDILLAFDEEDTDIGSFNQGCKEDYESFLNDKGHNISYIGSKTLNSLNVQLRLENLSSFIFAAYSHGDIDRLYCNEGDYVSTNVNISLFKDSFFYTVSCKSGFSLGNELINNGCKCFFGYKTLFNSWLGYRDFSECANYGFFKFIDGSTTDEVFNSMVDKYNEHIDNLYAGNFMQAALLRENRDGLIKLGENITINHFNQ